MSLALLDTPARINGPQPVDLTRHLGGIANLMEVCFGAQMDASGQSYIREMRFMSHFGPVLPMFNTLFLGQPLWDLGHVWLEDGKVVGSVSTQRSATQPNVWLIANVAVLPDYRRRGIARMLMQATLDLIQQRQAVAVILQVDDDNLGATQLYRALGFCEETTQTQWARPSDTPPPAVVESPLPLRLRADPEWPAQVELAALARPAGLSWNQPIAAADFRPNWRRAAANLVNGRMERHWVVSAPETTARLVGSLSLYTGGEGDRLVLLVHPAYTGQLEPALLTRALQSVGRRGYVSRLEHKADDPLTNALLRQLAFEPRRTLRWMRLSLSA
jgi:ribosomal protein S18 acetylase RimI-like enzyme